MQSSRNTVEERRMFGLRRVTRKGGTSGIARTDNTGEVGAKDRTYSPGNPALTGNDLGDSVKSLLITRIRTKKGTSKQ